MNSVSVRNKDNLYVYHKNQQKILCSQTKDLEVCWVLLQISDDYWGLIQPYVYIMSRFKQWGQLFDVLNNNHVDAYLSSYRWLCEKGYCKLGICNILNYSNATICDWIWGKTPSMHATARYTFSPSHNSCTH